MLLRTTAGALSMLSYLTPVSSFQRMTSRGQDAHIVNFNTEKHSSENTRLVLITLLYNVLLCSPMQSGNH